MKVARSIALFQQEQKQEGKNLSIYLQSVSPEPDIMESVVGNVIQHAGMGDDRLSEWTRCER